MAQLPSQIDAVCEPLILGSTASRVRDLRSSNRDFFGPPSLMETIVSLLAEFLFCFWRWSARAAQELDWS